MGRKIRFTRTIPAFKMIYEHILMLVTDGIEATCCCDYIEHYLRTMIHCSMNPFLKRNLKYVLKKFLEYVEESYHFHAIRRLAYTLYGVLRIRPEAKTTLQRPKWLSEVKQTIDCIPDSMKNGRAGS